VTPDDSSQFCAEYSDSLGYIFLLLFIFGFALIPFIYLLSLSSPDPSAAFSRLVSNLFGIERASSMQSFNSNACSLSVMLTGSHRC
jgi:hypothetical protein